jgi:hypothetical protein
MDTVGQNARIRMFNLTLPEMFLATFGLKSFPESFIVSEVKDPSCFFQDTSKGWRLIHSYCYESVLPLASGMDRMQKVRSDISGYFGVSANIVKQKLLCNILVRKDTSMLPSASGIPVATLLSRLNSRMGNTPWLNESGFMGRIQLDKTLDIMKDEKALLSALAEQGFTVIRQEREVTIFKIHENRFDHH